MNYLVINLLGETISHNFSMGLFHPHLSEHITLFGDNKPEDPVEILSVSQEYDLDRKNHEATIEQLCNSVTAAAPKNVFVYVVCVNHYVLDAIKALRELLGDKMRLYIISNEFRVRPLIIVPSPSESIEHSSFREVLEMKYLEHAIDLYKQRMNVFGECEVLVPSTVELIATTPLPERDPVYHWLNNRWRVVIKDPNRKQRSLQLLD